MKNNTNDVGPQTGENVTTCKITIYVLAAFRNVKRSPTCFWVALSAERRFLLVAATKGWLELADTGRPGLLACWLVASGQKIGCHTVQTGARFFDSPHLVDDLERTNNRTFSNQSMTAAQLVALIVDKGATWYQAGTVTCRKSYSFQTLVRSQIM